MKWCVFLLVFLLQACAIARGLDERLNIPQKDSPWIFDATIEQYRVKIAVPDTHEALAGYPEHIARSITRRIEYRTKNIDIMRQHAMNVDALLQKHNLQQPLEYERTLLEVVMSLHPFDTLNDDPLFRHWPLLEQLPDYSHIHLFGPVETADTIERSLRVSGYIDRVTVHTVDTWRVVENGIDLQHATTRWAQDLFEMARDEKGGEYIIAPASRWQINDLSRSDNGYIQELEAPNRTVIVAPLFFRGGNMLLGKSTHTILFVGEDVLHYDVLHYNDRYYYTALFAVPHRGEVLSLLAQLTGADEVVVLPNSRNLFHLDMAMSFIADGVAVVIKPEDETMVHADDRKVLASIERVLNEYGFKVVSVPTTSERLNNFQSPVNIVPYRHVTNMRLEALVPLFRDTTLEGNVSLNQKVADAFRAAGIHPVFIEDLFYTVRGNTHCAISVIR